ncbi:DUF6868 family protein [Maioricimonas sp. JC845]|uniref:DUF6868 family protein n=1 Tax=Maioricimonas sp. JC845 TaxID=3232138 RepID=UPI00345B1AC6
MDIATLKGFFLWCTVMNGVVLGTWTVLVLTVPHLVFEPVYRFFRISRQSFDLLSYAYIGLYKILIIVFNIVPYLSLLIVESRLSQQ